MVRRRIELLRERLGDDGLELGTTPKIRRLMPRARGSRKDPAAVRADLGVEFLVPAFGVVALR
jgi:hypothetical protein